MAGEGGVKLAARVFDPSLPEAPGLLMHHGLASSQHIWDLMLPRLTRRLRVVTFDARGHGSSAKPSRGYGFDHVVADALAVARGTQLRRPTVVGHSWGAMVTLELAARHRRSIAGAVLIDGGVHRMRDHLDWPTAKEILAPPHLRGMPLEEFRAVMRTLLADAVEITPDLEGQVLSMMRVRSDGTIAPRLARSNHFRILRAIWEQDPNELWARVKVPTLAIVARDPADLEASRADAAGRRSHPGSDPRPPGRDRVDARDPRPALATSGVARRAHRTVRRNRRRLDVTMFVVVLILLLLAAALGVLGAVLKAVAFLVITAVLTVIVLGAVAWWGFKRKAREFRAEYDRQITDQRVARYRVNEAEHDPERLPPQRDDRY